MENVLSRRWKSITLDLPYLDRQPSLQNDRSLFPIPVPLEVLYNEFISEPNAVISRGKIN
ncbi:hypothetical protein V0288_05515 [Pannus brasiliensis CCIBt3594]|uniref:Uncharacterized protein n=1 Tax=Pannus brasiliensis CCIBt3594 TaxID=1427578 RepID=A0AAW9QPB4_9CHRO